MSFICRVQDTLPQDFLLMMIANAYQFIHNELNVYGIINKVWLFFLI